MSRRCWGVFLGFIAALALWACNRQRPADAPPAPAEPDKPAVVEVAPPSSSAPDEAAPPPRSDSAGASDDPNVIVDTSEDVHVEIERDAGYFSFRAHTLKDGGFSFRVQGSVTVSGDGGAVHVRIGGDAGVP